MAAFNQQYKGMSILEVTILKGYNVSDAAVDFTGGVIRRIAPDRILVERMNDVPFMGKLGISDERYREISAILCIN